MGQGMGMVWVRVWVWVRVRVQGLGDGLGYGQGYGLGYELGYGLGYGLALGLGPHSPQSHSPYSHPPFSHSPYSHPPHSHSPQSHQPQSKYAGLICLHDEMNPGQNVHDKVSQNERQQRENPKINRNFNPNPRAAKLRLCLKICGKGKVCLGENNFRVGLQKSRRWSKDREFKKKVCQKNFGV